jgi:hypothetical protein
MKLMRSHRKGKRFMVEINGETLHFGSSVGRTYIDHKDKQKRQNYLARHRVREDWTKINAGSLSRFLLWGNSTSLQQNIKEYKKRFNI